MFSACEFAGAAGADVDGETMKSALVATLFLLEMKYGDLPFLVVWGAKRVI